MAGLPCCHDFRKYPEPLGNNRAGDNTRQKKDKQEYNSPAGQKKSFDTCHQEQLLYSNIADSLGLKVAVKLIGGGDDRVKILQFP